MPKKKDFKINWTSLKKAPKAYISKLSNDQIAEILKTASDYYFNKEKSIIPDEVYDLVEDYLRERDPNNPILKQVGAPVKGKGKVTLPFPMPSLDKIKPESDTINKWIDEYKRYGFVVSDKLDGVSILLVGDTGKWKIYSRGDARTGGDLSFLADYLKLPKPRKGIVVRAEAIIPLNEFKRYENEAKNPRNFIAGLFSPNRVSISPAIRKAKIIAHTLYKPKLKPSDAFKKLKSYGFEVPFYKVYKNLTPERLSKLLIKRKTEAPYEIDGLVVSANKKYEISTNNPDFIKAFKMLTPDQVADAKVKKVEWNVSRYGYLKPTIHIEPVKLRGVIIKKLTGFNAEFIKENKIGKGAILKIVRSGDVIPHIIDIVKKASKPDMPKIPYEWTESGTDIYIKKTTKETEKDIKVKVITHFLRCLGVEGISEGIISKLYDIGLDTIIKILKAKKQTFLKAEGIKEKLADKIFNEITKVKSESIPLYKLMYASNLFPRNIGEERIKLAVNYVSNRIVPYLARKSPSEKSLKIIKSEIEQIEGFSYKTAEQFTEGLKNFHTFFHKVRKYLKVENPLKSEKDRKDVVLKSLSVCFSGFRSRPLERYLEKHGAVVRNSLTRGTSILVVKDKNQLTSKLRKAKQYGIPVYTKEEFLEYLKEWKLKDVPSLSEI